jgi:hypothetical protein
VIFSYQRDESTAFPSIVKADWPSVNETYPESICSKVDFPLPEGPIIPTTSPFSIVVEKSAPTSKGAKKKWSTSSARTIESVAESTSSKRKMKETIAVWFSCGVASAVAAKKTIEKYGETHNILIVNNPVKNEHPDNLRFLADVETWLGQKIIKATNDKYPNADIQGRVVPL